ncbi:MAG: ATP-binding protein [Thermodesulfobacteriota bacterium]|nr:ATP-binding protein [Thermodesulfobacteriota bacterium]
MKFETGNEMKKACGPIATGQCPVTGLSIFSRPEWTDVSFGRDYRVTFSILDYSILLLRASGYATLHDLEHAILLNKEVLAKALPQEQPYIRLEDWSDLKGTSRNARACYVNYIKNRQRLAGLIFYKLSTFFKIGVKIGKRFNIVKFKVEIVDNYTDAVKRAQEILSTSQTHIENSPTNTDFSLLNICDRNVSPHKIASQPGWCYQAENFSVRYEVINGCVLHGITTGRYEKEHIGPSIKLREEVIRSTGLSESPYSLVLGLEESDGISQSTRKQYVQTILDLHKKYPFNMFIFYGVNRWLNAGINIARPLMPFKVKVVKDLKSALDLIDKEKSINIVPKPFMNDRDPAGKPFTSDQTQHYVDDLLKFIGEVDWETGGINEEARKDHSHPFGPVFDAIKLIKWELDDLWIEQKRVEEELKQAIETAKKANLAKSEFLANMSHELRTPLNHILGFTELVVDKNFGELNDIQEEYLNDVLSSSKHLLSLINDILDLSKVEAGKLELQPSNCNLKVLLENSLIMIKEKALKHGIRLSKHIDGIPQTITADERKLKQIMYNLLSNAVKFTPDGGEIRITADLADGSFPLAEDSTHRTSDQKPRTRSNESEALQEFIQISVMDTGIGIKREDIKRIFKPFEQVESSTNRRFQGTGLGLALTKKLVEFHSGKIWVESEGEGKGSTFRLVIPI